MYAEYFNLRELPFSIAPNPKYLYMSTQHQEALAHLLFGLQQDGGFVVLTGEVGTGKTTICKRLFEQLPTEVEVAFILNPCLDEIDLIETICQEFEIKIAKDLKLKDLLDKLNNYLLACHSKNKKPILLIDEAQNLSTELLEQLRLLTNLETNEKKLLQIILLGQPELAEKLIRKELRQFNQRIVARYHLAELNEAESRNYISHRLSVAGCDEPLFSKQATRKIFQESEGIPRLINLLCDRALLGCYSEGKSTVTKKMVQRSSEEIKGKHQRKLTDHVFGAILGLSTLLMLIVFLIKSCPSDHQTSSSLKSEQTKRKLGVSEKTRNFSGHEKLESAINDLISLWGISFEDQETNSCSLSEKIGLRCAKFAVNLDQILRMDRPFVVSIGREFFTIMQATRETFFLFAGDKEYQLSFSEFSQIFDGNIDLVWRMPPDYNGPITLNAKGPAVDWLSIQLALVNQETPSVDKNVIFSEEMSKKVERFQKLSGLTEDGVVDSLTWIYLNSYNSQSVPKLSN